MADQYGINRWAQVVRRPSAVVIDGHQPTIVPALGSEAPAEAARPGIRLLVHPVADREPHWTVDVTSTAALAMLEGFLASGIGIGRELSWQSRGYGVRRRDTLRIRPPR